MSLAVRICVLCIAIILGGSLAPAQDSNFKPVTDAMLQNPDPSDWLNYRRTQDAWGYSPLNQINTRNVSQIQLAWSWTLGLGISEPTPLVHDGVMYLPSPNGLVQALNAATGELLWQYKRDSKQNGYGMMRSLAMFDDKIFLPTNDAHIIALNARTGTLVWDHTVADWTKGYSYTSGPIVVKGKVVAGIQGCQKYKNDVCFISAYDAETGNEVWRTSTIARPGEPGGDTWGDLPLTFRAGGDAWITGSYDPNLNLIYYSTAQAKPWARFQRGDMEGSELYTNSTLALDPETGKIVWYHQFIPGDSHDMDEVYENILVDHDGRSSLFKMGKLGILWEIDRRTGAFVAAHDLGYQTIYDVNTETGALKFRAGMVQKAGVEVDFCPSVIGFMNWQAMAYHPETKVFYIPLQMSCETTTYGDVAHTEGGGGVGARIQSKDRRHSESPDAVGDFIAMDINTGRSLWRHKTRTPMTSAVLTTGGGLVVAGDWDRNLYVHDAATGKVLFQTRLSSAIQGFPITYAVGGKQYLAIPVGTGSPRAAWAARILPEKQAPPIGNGLFVFALPDGPTSQQTNR